MISTPRAMARPAASAALIVALLGLTAAAQADAPVTRYQGEELYYALEFFGSSLARGALVVGSVEDHEDHGRVITIEGLAMTEGVAALVYPLRDTGTTLISPETGLAITTMKELDERGEFRSYRVDFDQPSYQADVTRVRDGQTNYYERILPSNTHDAFSWIYAIREQNLTPGTTQVYFLYDGWKLSRVTATVLEGREDVLVGDEFIECRRINLYREVMDSTRVFPMIQETADLPPAMWVRDTASGEQVGQLWVSTDHRHLPVQIEFSNQLITATAQLERYRAPTSGYLRTFSALSPGE